MQDDIPQNRPIKELPLSLYDFLFTPIGQFVKVRVTRSRTRTKMRQRIIPPPHPHWSRQNELNYRCEYTLTWWSQCSLWYRFLVGFNIVGGQGGGLGCASYLKYTPLTSLGPEASAVVVCCFLLLANLLKHLPQGFKWMSIFARVNIYEENSSPCCCSYLWFIITHNSFNCQSSPWRSKLTVCPWHSCLLSVTS